MKSPPSLLGWAVCAASLVDAINHRSSDWTVGQVVKTSSGLVSGHGSSVNTDVSEYLGIPYAVPPVGDLRWTAPEAFKGTKAINGTSFGFSCPAFTQSSSGGDIQSANITASGLTTLAILGQVGDKFSEDCLTVNVWTKPQVGEAKKAVLVWIYGGGFSSGTSDSPAYNGQFIAEQEDVVLVSLNYRLNVFGFPGIPDSTKNLGLLDQRLAIEWVRENIEAFGGDTSRITLFGQSAGSASVDYYTYAWVKDPIAHSFIQESGSVLGPAGGLGAITESKATYFWFNLSSALQCGDQTADATTSLACMRSKPYSLITSTMADLATDSSAPIASTFGPTVDEVVVFSDYLQRSISGNYTKLPLLLGNTDYEAGLFRVLDTLKNVSYPDAYYDGFNRVAFVCPCSARANVSVINKVPTWRYRWFGAFPNTQLTTIPYSGAWHASELPVLFDNLPKGEDIPKSTDAEVKIGKYIRGAWATFAKDPVNGLKAYEDGWPLYDPYAETLIRLAFNNMTGVNLAPATMYDGGCENVISVNGTGNSSAPTSTGNSSAPTTAGTGSAPSSTPTKDDGTASAISMSSLVGMAVAVCFALL